MQSETISDKKFLFLSISFTEKHAVQKIHRVNPNTEWDHFGQKLFIFVNLIYWKTWRSKNSQCKSKYKERPFRTKSVRFRFSSISFTGQKVSFFINSQSVAGATARWTYLNHSGLTSAHLRKFGSCGAAARGDLGGTSGGPPGGTMGDLGGTSVGLIRLKTHWPNFFGHTYIHSYIVL